MSETSGAPRRRRLPATIRRAKDVDARVGGREVAAHDEQPPAVVDAHAEQKSERQVALIFLASAACTVGFAIGYVAIGLKNINDVELSNYVLGLTLTGALGFLGIGMVLWTKLLMPHYQVTEERHPFASPDADRQEFAEVFNQGLDELGLVRRPILRRSLLTAAGLLGVLPIFMLRDLGPKPEKTLFHTRWTKDARLTDIVSKQPVKVGDIEIGGLMTVMPEGVAIEDKNAATSPVILIRLRLGENVPYKGREDWAPEGYVAYNKLCTHAGCPIGLYEQQTHQLFCPCHQSTFNVLKHCRVVFGPAARPLPQLPIYIDDQGYFRARSDFTEPVGPSFWERG
ncbi:MAG: ubiquinol-cytochrome c reductase iron-sulfur subunit [Frankiales bacterium]|jgi:ubiquinol-cytochrome c reductase iron-sulfur subunit|nr:ubiquinol-cytochrome c reductase iron-sulfur subunit [Frankiales bacterium]